MLYGTRLWPGIVIGDLLVADFSSPLGTVLGQTLGNTLEILVAAVLLRRLIGNRTGLERVGDVFALVAAAAAGALISASFGATSLRLGEVIPADQFAEVWRTWWLSDFSGALVVTPLILTWATRGVRGLSRWDLLEGAAVLTALVLLAELPSQRDVPYVVFPVLIWAALRFGPRGAATALVVVSSLTVWNTAHNAGPFVRESITDSLLSSQLFLATAALTALVLAAVTAERTEPTRRCDPTRSDCGRWCNPWPRASSSATDAGSSPTATRPRSRSSASTAADCAAGGRRTSSAWRWTPTTSPSRAGGCWATRR